MPGDIRTEGHPHPVQRLPHRSAAITWERGNPFHPERQRDQPHAAIHLHGKVQVRAGAEAGVARPADVLAGTHALAALGDRTVLAPPPPK